MTVLWPDSCPVTGGGNLSIAISQLAADRLPTDPEIGNRAFRDGSPGTTAPGPDYIAGVVAGLLSGHGWRVIA